MVLNIVMMLKNHFICISVARIYLLISNRLEDPIYTNIIAYSNKYTVRLPLLSTTISKSSDGDTESIMVMACVVGAVHDQYVPLLCELSFLPNAGNLDLGVLSSEH